MAERPALVTGFEPYAGRSPNPASEVARAVEVALDVSIAAARNDTV